MKNGFLYRFIVFLTTVLLLATPVLATTSLSSADGSTDFNTHLSHFTYPDDEINASPDPESAGASLGEKFTLPNLIGIAAESFSEYVKSYFKHFSGICVLVLLCGILCATKENSSLHNLAEYSGNLALGVYCSGLVNALCLNIELILSEICAFLIAALPSVSAIYASSVGPATASSSYTVTLTALNLIQSTVTFIVLPGVKILLMLSCMSAATRFMDMSGVYTLVKSCVMWFLGILVSMISAVMFFQTALSASADGLAVRSMRYAAQSAIPIIGGVVSESMRVVTESLRLVKSVCGTAGIFTLITLILPPITLVVTYRIFFGMTSALAGMLGVKKGQSYLKELQGIVNILFACVVAVSFVGIIMLGIFVKTIN